jgi:hypothetical protein
MFLEISVEGTAANSLSAESGVLGSGWRGRRGTGRSVAL